MATTTRYTWPTPELSDPPTVPEHFSALANAVEETVGAMDDRLTTLTGLSQSIFQYTTLTRVSTNIMTIENEKWSAVYFDTAQFNLPAADPGWSFATPDRITCRQTGLYRITGMAGFEKNGNGSRGIALRVNGFASYPALQTGLPAPDLEWFGNVYVEGRVNENDYIQLVVRQSSGGDLKLDPVQPRFSMQRLL